MEEAADKLQVSVVGWLPSSLTAALGPDFTNPSPLDR